MFLRSEHIVDELNNYCDLFENTNLEFECNRSSKYKLKGLTKIEHQDLITFIIINVFQCVRLSFDKGIIHKDEEKNPLIYREIINLLKNNKFSFDLQTFTKKQQQFTTSNKAPRSCQRVKVNKPPNKVSDKLKSSLFNNENVTCPWAIKFSIIQNNFKQSGFNAIMNQMAIGIDIVSKDKKIVVRIISIKDKH